jgi:hypothetical protein
VDTIRKITKSLSMTMEEEWLKRSHYELKSYMR